MTANEVRNGSPPASTTPVLKAATLEETKSKSEDPTDTAKLELKPLPMSSTLSSERSDPSLSAQEVDKLAEDLRASLEIKRGRPRKVDAKSTQEEKEEDAASSQKEKAEEKKKDAATSKKKKEEEKKEEIARNT